jgi:transposase
MEKFTSSRVEQFRQVKNEIRGSSEHLIVGIDVAKDKHHAFFGTATGKALLRRLVFENSVEGFEKLLIQTEAVKTRHILSKVVFGLEPTANYHKPLAEYLIKRDHMVVLVGGEAIKKNRTLLDGRWDSNDTKDAANVADLISQGKCLYYDYPCLPLRELRGLLSLKRRLRKQEHGLRVRIRNHLIAQYFPELDRYYGKGGREILAIVSWCVNPAVIAGMAFERFVGLVAPGMRTGAQRKRLEAIWALSANSVGCEAGRMLEFEAKIMVDALREVREAIRATDEKIEELCLQFPEYVHLLSIPGFGPDVSSKVLGAIGDPYRFNNENQVLKMAGLDLSAERSGKTSQSAVPVISKKGKADLRYALYQAAMVASISDRHVVVYFTNKLRGRERERGIKTKMRVKLAAKMLVIAWSLMKKKEPFDPAYLNTE